MNSETYSKLYSKVFKFCVETLNVNDHKFSEHILNLYLKKQHADLKLILEPEYFEKLQEILRPFEENSESLQSSPFLLGNTSINNENSLENLKDDIFGFYSADKKVDKTHGFDEESSTIFDLDPIPESLVPDPIEKEPSCGLKSFIFKMENEDELINNDDNIEEKIELIKKAFKTHRIVLVQGDTGCGKTTVIPKMLLSDFSKIVCTQPRKLAAISIAKKVANDLKCSLGSLVGYAVRFDSMTSKKTRLTFVTDGVLLKEFTGMNKIKYDLIIIDEAHERTLNVDFLLGYLKANSQTKLLIMSATIDTEKFVSYFDCPVIQIKKRNFSIEIYHLKHPVKNYLNKTIETIIKIIKEYPIGDVLAFLTGQEDINRSYEVITEYLTKNNLNIKVLKLHSGLSPEEQELVFKKYSRKIILSTNIAETSITIEKIKFVVDCGKCKQKRRSSDVAIDFLEVVNISKSQAKQRSGRAGRTEPGIVFRIYSYNEYVLMEENTVPEILRSGLEDTILTLKSLNIRDVINFDYIDPPKIESLKNGLIFLYYLRAIDSQGNITNLGKNLSTIPLEPSLAMVLLTAYKLNCLEDAAKIMSFLISQPIFLKADGNDKNLNSKENWHHPKGDFYMYLEIYKNWENRNFSMKFLKNYGLNPRVMKSIPKIKDQLISAVKKVLNPEEKKAKKQQNAIEKAFCSGLFMNIAKKQESGYKTVFGDIECNIHPSDGLFKQEPKYLLYFELVCVRKEFMRGCLEVDLESFIFASNSQF